MSDGFLVYALEACLVIIWSNPKNYFILVLGRFDYQPLFLGAFR